MEQKHTPEPWYIQPHPWPPSIRRGKEGDEIAHAQSPYSNEKYREEERANGDRIVACVNAMAGIPDPSAFRREEVEVMKLLMRRMVVNELVGIDDTLGKIDQQAYDQATAFLAKYGESK